jgi:hypothetical protein
MRSLIAALSIVAVTNPAFADQLWDTCHKLAQDRVGPVQQSNVGDTTTRHYEDFVLQCLAGKIPLAQASVNRPAPMHTGDGKDSSLVHRDIRCFTSGINGQKYCY